MSVQEMTRTEQEMLIHTTDDVYDDGFLRVEHRNYYVSCGGSPVKLPRTEFLIFSRLVRTTNRIVTADELWSSFWAVTSRLIPKAFTSISIACVQRSPISDSRSRRWSTSATG